MQMALVNNVRVEAFRGGKAVCPTCGAEMIAKCGNRIVHHWAHASLRDCDPWWENETQWHREWKNMFPAECREINHVAANGEIHRADVRTPTGIYIEFQHSSITDVERQSRDNFYQNLVWVVDARGFADNFDIYHLLPAPESEIAKDLIWSKATREYQGCARGIFFRRSDTPDSPNHCRMYGIGDIEEDVNAAYRGHHQYHWTRPRKAWLESDTPVYLDFGNDELIRLEKYPDDTQLPCIFRVHKCKFLHDVMVETSARSIASRYYRLPD